MDTEAAVECVAKSSNMEVTQIPVACSKTSSKEEECKASGVSNFNEDLTWIKKRNSKRNSLSNFEKRILIQQIKDHPCIWDVNDFYHSDAAAVENAWMAVSAAVEKPIPNCKAAWAFLQEAKRYRTEQERKAETEDGGETTSSEMLEHSYFQTQASKKRRVMEYPLVLNNREPVDEDAESSSSESISDYTFSSSSSEEDEEERGIERLVTSVEKLVDSYCSKMMPANPPLVHYAILANIDRLLQLLPPLEVPKVILEIERLILAKIEQHKND